MSYVLDKNAGKLLSATLTGTTIAVQTHNRLITFGVKFASIGAFDVLANLGNGANIRQSVNVYTGQSDAFFTPDGFTSEWEAGITPEPSTGVWMLKGCYMPANANGVSKTIKHYQDSTTATMSLNGTADTGNMMALALGNASFPPDILITDYAIWLVANEAAADSIFTGLYGGGFVRKANAIGHIAQPDYYWPLVDNLAAVNGSPTLTNTGSVASSTDMPTFRPRGRASLLGVGAP